MAHLEDARKTSQAEPFHSKLESPWRRRAFQWESWLPFLIALALLSAWEALTRAAILSALFFPAPSTIFLSAQRLIQNGTLTIDLGATLARVFAGFVLGGVPGLILGLAMGWSPRLRTLMDPFIAAAHPLPKIALLPLLMIVAGVGESSRLILIALGAFFPMLLNAMAGVREINPIHFDVARNYGASTLKLFSRVILPGALPLVLAGVRLAFNIALLLTIAVEIATAKEGLGARIWLSWQTFRVEELYVTLFFIASIGFLLNLALERLAARFVPWRSARGT